MEHGGKCYKNIKNIKINILKDLFRFEDLTNFMNVMSSNKSMVQLNKLIAELDLNSWTRNLGLRLLDLDFWD